MRIAHFLLGRSNPDSANGVDKTVYFLSREQARGNDDVSVFSITPLLPIEIPGVEVFTYPPRRVLPMATLSRPASLPRNPFILPKALLADLADWRPDIIHFHSVHVPEAILVARRLRKEGVPYCVTPNGGLARAAWRESGRLKKRVFYSLAERTYLSRASFLHAVSITEKQDFRSLGLDSRVVVAPNCIDSSIVPNQFNAALLFERLPRMKGNRIVLFLGRLDPAQKGLDLLLKAWAHARKPPNLALIIVGPDWRGGRARLKDLARSLEISDSFALCAPVSGQEKWDLLASSDAFIQPSRWEGAPFAVLEAMAVGRLVAATPAAWPHGTLSEHDAGITLRPDVSGIAEGIEYIGNLSKSELQRLGRNAQRLVQQHFRWEIVAEELIQAYQGVI